MHCLYGQLLYLSENNSTHCVFLVSIHSFECSLHVFLLFKSKTMCSSSEVISQDDCLTQSNIVSLPRGDNLCVHVCVSTDLHVDIYNARISL